MPYQMTPIAPQTRLRVNHNTFADVVTSYNPTDLIVGVEVWEAPADGIEVKKGDTWLLVTTVNGVNLAKTGWMAYIHKGVAICKDFKAFDVPPAPGPGGANFPDSFVMEDPAGNKAEYKFVRLLV